MLHLKSDARYPASTKYDFLGPYDLIDLLNGMKLTKYTKPGEFEEIYNLFDRDF